MLAQDIAVDLRLKHFFARAAPHALAQPGRGDLDHTVERKRPEALSAETRREPFRLRGKGRGAVRFVPVKGDDLRQPCDLLRCAPRLKGEEHIRPHKEQQLVVWILLPQGAERIDRIAFPLPPHLKVEHLDRRAALERGLRAHELRHGKAMLIGGTSLLHLLVRREARRNEQELIKAAFPYRFDGRVLVAEVRRVEAAAVNSDLQ